MTAYFNVTSEQFWQAYCQFAQLSTDIKPDVFAFGDSGEMADELAALVISGTKTATTAAADVEPDAMVGEYSVILDGHDHPVAVIQTVVYEEMPFNQVSAEHAYHEGENDRSLASWRQEHETFWRRELAAEGGQFSEDMQVACEVFVLKATQATVEPYLKELFK
ncbi:ASCH domain-containing protein [Furfurilactobacillus siliginis]|uniref:RNA-binding protein n=1 Tax=Furfurilactobacillus siliginis TaxID=348151 RepID=A0A0R2L339_9LACO|nr:ASCH domain-containing protein [Furfurilactobacillus siliginis]KRN96030.1 hypothetical protein IV55_GL001711 [Furfurilactobacillus siliginis]GEK29280.1 RNA-binding protein [Furfurilactobacillus siliginis]